MSDRTWDEMDGWGKAWEVTQVVGGLLALVAVAAAEAFGRSATVARRAMVLGAQPDTGSPGAQPCTDRQVCWGLPMRQRSARFYDRQRLALG
jgi:hypothetical protein